MGRPKLSKSVGLSRQVLSAADTTLASYMSIAFDKLSMFNDEGLCSLTSATDIDPLQFASEPTALFLKIPDEKDTRHALAAVFVLCIYKALIKVASAREDLSLPRNVYFILDEFGNMPKIDKFDKMITVGRSRKIWFQRYRDLRGILQAVRQQDGVHPERFLHSGGQKRRNQRVQPGTDKAAYLSLRLTEAEQQDQHRKRNHRNIWKLSPEN